MRIVLAVFACMGSLLAGAQAVSDWKNTYRETPEKGMSLVHTKLDVKFDYAKRQMDGKAWVTMSPYFYATDSAILDAKGMEIRKVAMMQGEEKKVLAYNYKDGMTLRIGLPKTYNQGEQAILYIEYTAKPDELKAQGSAAIQSAKGLYFINPDGKDSTKPIQIWTQGETEATSVWCPTVDRPNQKQTQEIRMTVPDQYVSLSNGILVSQVNNKDGTRSDTWKMELPHAPYLMFMGVGDFAVIRDKYKNIAVDYYVEKEYASVGQRIFGDTPEMIGFFGKLLGVEYPWAKYAQMVGTDFVSGAMENTTATLHGAYANQSARQLVDGNGWEVVIAHELFHHWFGDLVTAESWSNLTVNESFADYSEFLWTEHKYGQDAADAYNYAAMLGYMNNPNEQSKHLVRFTYRDKEDMFDQVSYQKGGRILNMLRQYVGDSAFFKGMNVYLNSNKFKAAEAHQFRLSLEQVSGRDLNPFFNQWFFNSGHPEVDIAYGTANGKDFIAFEQKQKDRIFQLPLTILSYNSDGKTTSHAFMLSKKTDTFFIAASGTPTFYEADAKSYTLWQKKEQKSPEAWAAQYRRMGGFVSRKEALDAHNSLDTLGEGTRQLMIAALSDPFYGIKNIALAYFAKYTQQLQSNQNWVLVEQIAQNENHKSTRAGAIDVLAKRDNKKYLSLYKLAAYDSSYTVAGAALDALTERSINDALKLKEILAKDADGRLASALDVLEIAASPLSETDNIIAAYKKKPGLQRIGASKGMVLFAARQTDFEKFKAVLSPVFDMYKRIPAGFGTYKSDLLSDLVGLLKKKEQALIKQPKNTALTASVDWLKSQIK